MEEAKAYQVNSKDLNRKLLIATQGSAFKDTVTGRIVNHYKQDSVFIKVIDISSLQDIAPEEYTAILLVHTWENWKPPLAVKQFIERTTGHKDKIVILTTSGEGTYQMKGVDALTGESNLEEAPVFANKIIDKLEVKLKQENQ